MTHTPLHSQHDNASGGRHDTAVGTLLGVWAHPDDEAYMSAGLMWLARSAGDRVVVATATRGELGTDDPVQWPPQLLAQQREREMEASLNALGVEEHRWLGRHDGDLHRVSARRGTAQVAALIREIRPDTIVTFGPDGMTGHADHKAVSHWVTAAWASTGHAARLWYATVTPEFHHTWGAVNDDVGFWFEGSQPPSDPEQDLAHVVRCEGALREVKFAALQAHSSQTTGLIQRIGAARYRRWWSTECFVDASRRHQQPRFA